MRTDIVRPSLIEENVAPMIVYRVWVRDACDDWWGGPDLNELSCCMIGKYPLTFHWIPFQWEANWLVGSFTISRMSLNIFYSTSSWYYMILFQNFNIYIMKLNTFLKKNEFKFFNLYRVPFPTEKHYLLYNSIHTHQHLSDLTLELKERKIQSNQDYTYLHV